VGIAVRFVVRMKNDLVAQCKSIQYEKKIYLLTNYKPMKRLVSEHLSLKFAPIFEEIYSERNTDKYRMSEPGISESERIARWTSFHKTCLRIIQKVFGENLPKAKPLNIYDNSSKLDQEILKF
jgi:hypothetical protein